MASPPSSQTDDEPITAEQPGQDPQRDFLRQGLAHARWFARCFGAQGEEATRWLDEGLSCYPLALGRAMPARRPQLFWRALLGAELPGSGRMELADDAHPVEELLAQLDPAARAAFLLRVWHDFDDELLADLLGLRIGQVRVGLMRAFGLMRARLDDGIDAGGVDTAQWLRQFRARLAVLGARDDVGEQDADRQRLARLLGEALESGETATNADHVDGAEVEAADDEVLDALAQLRETSLLSAEAIDAAGAEQAALTATQHPRGALSPRPPRRLPLPRWGLVAVGLALLAMVVWWATRPSDTSTVADPPVASAPVRESPAPPPQVSAPPSRDEEAVLASPDLPLFDGRLTPSQLAVMDQLRWWASTQPTAEDAAPSMSSVDAASEPMDEAPTTFEQLAAADRRLLQGFATLWPRLGTEQRLTLLDNARRWRVLDTSGRERVVRRSQSFNELPAQARTRARDSFALWQSLPPAERDGLVMAFAAFSALSPEQQRAVADGFARLSPSEQAHWRFAEGERELLALAGRVFSFVPEAERAATLALLQSLDEADRDRLRQGTRRMSAWQREQLRKALLAEPVDGRSNYLRRRFGS